MKTMKDIQEVADEGVEFGVVKEEGGRSGMLLGTLTLTSGSHSRSTVDSLEKIRENCH